MSQNGWTQSTIEIACQEGPEDVPAMSHENAPGVAVTMHRFGLFDVTHVPSGTRIVGPYERAGSALLAMAELAACFDFTLDREAFRAQFAERRDDPVPFAGATRTDGNGTRPLTVGEWLSMERTRILGDEFPWESPDDDPWEKADELVASLER